MKTLRVLRIYAAKLDGADCMTRMSNAQSLLHQGVSASRMRRNLFNVLRSSSVMGMV